MKILLVHNFYQQPGGEDQVFADEGALLERKGHVVAQLTLDNDSIVGMSKLALARKTIWNSDSQELVRSKIREIGAHVVHFHNTFPLISPAAYYTAHEEGAAVVQTLHNYRLLCPAATFYRDGKVCEDCLGKAVPWPGVAHQCYRQSRSASAVTAALLTFHRARGTWQKQVDRYIALTEFCRDKFIEGGLPRERIIVKPNFVDSDLGAGEGGGDFAVFVGRLTEEKGVDLLIKAWKFLYDKTGLKLKIIGDGPLVETVAAASRQNGGIEYLGRRPSAEVYQTIGQAQMLMFPSQWYEGQPRTIVESLARGTPVIATRLGSMSGMIEHGRQGLLFEPGNVEDLIRQVELFLQSTTDKSQMRRAARLEYESKYTAERNYSMLIDCYQSALDALNRTSHN